MRLQAEQGWDFGTLASTGTEITIGAVYSKILIACDFVSRANLEKTASVITFFSNSNIYFDIGTQFIISNHFLACFPFVNTSHLTGVHILVALGGYNDYTS